MSTLIRVSSSEINQRVPDWAVKCLFFSIGVDFLIGAWRGGCGAAINNQGLVQTNSAGKVVESSKQKLFQRLAHGGMGLMSMVFCYGQKPFKAKDLTGAIIVLVYGGQFTAVSSVRVLGLTIKHVYGMAKQVFKSLGIIAKTILTSPNNSFVVISKELTLPEGRYPFLSLTNMLHHLRDLKASPWEEKGFRLSLAISQLVPIPATIIIYHLVKAVFNRMYLSCMSKIIK